MDLASLLSYKRGSSCRSPPAPLCVGEANTCQFQGHGLSPVGVPPIDATESHLKQNENPAEITASA